MDAKILHDYMIDCKVFGWGDPTFEGLHEYQKTYQARQLWRKRKTA